MLGGKQNLMITTAGLYTIPLGDKQIMEKLHSNHRVNVTFNVTSPNLNNKKKIVQKLHVQYAHPPVNKFIKLVDGAGLNDDENLKTKIKNLSDSCEICNVYRKPASQPIVGFSITTEFNEIVVMDINGFNGKLILHVIDHVTLVVL